MAGREITAAQIAGRIDSELAIELFPGLDAARCAARKWEIDDEVEAELHLVEGAAQLIRRLVNGHELAICSSCRPQLIERRLDRVGIRSSFRVIVGRIDEIPHKPAPDLYMRTLTRLGVSATNACAIEDSPTGVAAAKAAGIYTIQLLHPGLPRAAAADAWVHSLAEIAPDRD
jgi:HAD superfamily hydrolase (TIGR01509 family)